MGRWPDRRVPKSSTVQTLQGACSKSKARNAEAQSSSCREGKGVSRSVTRKPSKCEKCGSAVNDAFICRRCGRELRHLLISEGWPDRLGELGAGQPGIIWYMRKLHEAAYKQSKLQRGGTRGSRHGYYLLGDNRAIKELARISKTLARWNTALDGLIGAQTLEEVRSKSATLNGYHDLDAYRARRLAAHIPELRHKCPGIASLHTDMLDYAKTAWKIINRPNDICCGACPNPVLDKDDPEAGEQPCGVVLYAEESEEKVQCPKCRVVYDVSERREDLMYRSRSQMFTAPQLRQLMETRLNDKMPKTAFYQLIRDGRLQPRAYDNDDAPMYTYDDVCAAREKTKPGRRNARKA
jgi:hypothetical protein